MKKQALSYFAQICKDIEKEGLKKQEKHITSPQGVVVKLSDGRELINMCANNYLGLANNAEVIAAIDKEIDLFGVLFLSLVTAFGGGLLRDVLIGRTPAFFSAYFHIACAATAALIVFLVAALLKKRYVVREALIGRINNYFDAVGLGIFAVMGAKACVSAGHTSALVVISLGMITGIGGGMVRDLCLKEIPFVLKKHVYAVAALAGAAIYYLIFRVAHIPEYIALLLGIVAVVAIRLLATKFKLNIPKAIVFEKEKKQV